MKFALHGMLTMHSNIATDIDCAAKAGYDGVELHTDKLWRYIEAGRSVNELRNDLKSRSLAVSAIDIIGGVECSRKDDIEALLEKSETLINVAAEIGAHTIQLNAFSALDGISKKEQISIIAANIRKIAELGKKQGIRFQYEGAAWTPISSLEDCLWLIEETACDNFGLVIDFWHFWASEKTDPDQIAKLDPNIIYNVHCSGGYRAAAGQNLVDERVLRDCFPCEGDLPVKNWVEAVKACGYDGWVSGELLGYKCWENTHDYNAQQMLRDLHILFFNELAVE